MLFLTFPRALADHLELMAGEPTRPNGIFLIARYHHCVQLD